MDIKAETWCDRDEHKLFEYYVDFDEWLDSEEAASAREAYGVDGISVPSKAFFAGDKEAYDQAWRGRTLTVTRNIVQGLLTTPKNHQRRRVDVSHQLLVALRLWRRRQRAAWLKVGRPRPEWVFSSVTGTALDESNVRKAFNRLLDAAGLRRRGPHQMRHTFASLLLAAGEPITYVSRQLGHHDASMTLRVYAHWLPDTSARKSSAALPR